MRLTEHLLSIWHRTFDGAVSESIAPSWAEWIRMAETDIQQLDNAIKELLEAFHWWDKARHVNAEEAGMAAQRIVRALRVLDSLKKEPTHG